MKTKQKNLLKLGNAKLDKTIAIFNLPAVVTCGRACPGCYALKAEKRFPAVRASRLANLEAAKSPNFVHVIIGELRALGGKVKAVRVHESGDFYSPEYVQKWARVAKACPGLVFYAYTKRLQPVGVGDNYSAFRSALNELATLENFVLIDSCQYGEVNYGTAEELKPALAAGAFLCPCGTSDDKPGVKMCGTSCKYCQTKKAQAAAPVFIKH